MSILSNAAKSGNCIYSFDEFYAKYHAIVFTRVFKALRHQQDTEDVVQEIFFKASRAWSGLAHHDYLFAWIWKITTNSLIDFHRNAHNRGHGIHAELEEADSLIDPHNSDPYDVCDADELSEQAARAWQTLTPHHQHILALATDLRPREIAVLLGYSEGQANSKVGNARDAFKRRYKREAA